MWSSSGKKPRGQQQAPRQGGVLPGRGLLVAPSFHNSIWRSRSRGATDGVQVLAGSVKLLSSQGESGNNIGPPPIHLQAHCIGLGGGWGDFTRGGGNKPGLRWTHAEGPRGNGLRNICKGAEEA